MQTVKVDSEHVTIRRKFKAPGRWIMGNYQPNRRYRLEREISMSNPACGFNNQFNWARRLLA
jgi:hypothetical protein